MSNYKSYRGEVEQAMKEAMQTSLEAVGLEGQRDVTMKITDNKQVDTGRMRASISYIQEDKSVHIGTNVEYAPMQEKINPFLTPAIKNNMDRYADVIQSIFSGLVGE